MLRKLRVFHEVAETGSVSKAAINLHMAQPAVSLILKDLEAYYQVSLFDRLSNRLYITPAGQHLYLMAQQVLAELDKLDTSMKESDFQQSLRLGAGIAASSGKFVHVVKQLQEEYPSLSITVEIEKSPDIEQKVLDNIVDIGIIEGVSHHPKLISEVIYTDEYQLVASPECPYEHITVVEIKNFPMILREPTSNTRGILDEAFASTSGRMNIIWSSVSIDAIKLAVKAGLGYSLLPRQLIEDDLREGTLKVIKIEDFMIKRTVSWVMHRDRQMSESMKRLVELFISNL